MQITSTMDQLFGDFLMKGAEEKIATKSLFGKGKIFAIYFSAGWCKACQTFTPALVEFYKSIKRSDKGKTFDIVFVSSDNEEDEFMEYYGEMPWLALPFVSRDKKTKLSRKFRIQGIPALIVMDGESGDIITTSGVAKVTNDLSGDQFPWKPKPFSEIIRGNLTKNESGEVDADGILKGKLVGLYFSAHWCPPCRGFTPDLVNTYTKLRDDNKNFEIVFISKDRSAESFTQYFETMPWLAVPYGDKRTEELISFYGVEGIPCLIMLDKEGTTITRHGREMVRSDPEGKDFPWYPKAVNLLTMDHVGVLNASTCLILFTDGEDSDIAMAQETLQPQAEREHQKGSEQDLFFFYTNDDDFSDYLRDFALLEDQSPLLVILDITARRRYVSDATDITRDAIKQFVDQYFSGKLIAEPINT